MRGKRIVALVITLIAVAALRAFADEVPDPVGLRGDPARLQFTGTLPASADRLRYLLAGDPDTVEAAEPEKPMAEYLSTLDRRLREAMWANGYPRPSVDIDATTEAGQIIVKLDPGKRVHCGAIDIRGDVKRLDVDGLRLRLTAPVSSGRFENKIDNQHWLITSTFVDNKPDTVWDAKEWAHFDPATLDILASQIESTLAEAGHMHSHVKIDVDSEGVLHIAIAYLSPLAKVKKVSVKGAKRNSIDSIITLSNLHPEQTIDLKQLQEAQRRLWDSGRFNIHSIAIDPMPSGDLTEVAATINVQENEGPLIGKPFSPIEQVMLKSGRWLTGLSDSTEELAFDFSSRSLFPNRVVNVQVVTGGRNGIEAGCKLLSASNQLLIDLDIIANSSQIIAASRIGHLRCELSPLSNCVSANVNLLTNDEGIDHLNFGVGASIKYDESAAAVPFHCDYQVSPAASVNLSHLKGWQYSLVLDQLSLSKSNNETSPAAVLISTATGALLKLVTADSDPKLAAAFAPRKIENDLAAIQADPSETEVGFSTFVFSQLGRAVLASNGADATRVTALTGTLESVFSSDAFAPITFPLSTLTNDFSMDIAGELRANPSLLLFELGRPYVDRIWSRGSWPWSFSNFLLTYEAGQKVDSWEGDLKVLAGSGPMGCLAGAEVFSNPAHEISITFAKLGLSRLDDAAFVTDLHSILVPGSGAAESCDRLVANLRKLSPQQVDDLIAGLSDKWRSQIRAAIDSLRADANESGSAAVTKLLASQWPLGLRDVVKSELERLAAKR